MITKKVQISGIQGVKDFVCETMLLGIDVTLRVDRYAVDAKSIMGVFSLDLGKPLELILETDAPESQYADYFAAIKQFIIE